MASGERRPPSPAMLAALAEANRPQVVDAAAHTTEAETTSPDSRNTVLDFTVADEAKEVATAAAIETHHAGGLGDEVVVDGLQDAQLIEVPELPSVPAEYIDETQSYTETEKTPADAQPPEEKPALETTAAPSPARQLEATHLPQLYAPEQEASLTGALRALAADINAFDNRLYAVALQQGRAQLQPLTEEQVALFNPNNTGEDWATELNTLRLVAQDQDLNHFTEALAGYVQAVLTREFAGKPATDRPPVDRLTIIRFVRVFLRSLSPSTTPAEVTTPVQAKESSPQPVVSAAAENTARQAAAQPQKKTILGKLGDWWNSAPWTNSATQAEALPVTATLNLTPPPAQEPAVTSTVHEATGGPTHSEAAQPAAVTAPGTHVDVVTAATSNQHIAEEQPVAAVTSTELTTASDTTATTHPAEENGHHSAEPATFIEFAADGQEEVQHTTKESRENKEKLLAELEEELIEHAEILSQELLGRTQMGRTQNEKLEALEITEEDQERVITLIFNPLIEYLEVLQESPRNLDANADEPFALISHLIMMLVNARIPLRSAFRDDPSVNTEHDDEIYQASTRAMGSIQDAINYRSQYIAEARVVESDREIIERNLKYMLTGPYQIILFRTIPEEQKEEELAEHGKVPSILEFDV
jgi:hypothetical protein